MLRIRDPSTKVTPNYSPEKHCFFIIIHIISDIMLQIRDPFTKLTPDHFPEKHRLFYYYSLAT